MDCSDLKNTAFSVRATMSMLQSHSFRNVCVDGVSTVQYRELQIAFAVNSLLARSRLCFIMRRDARSRLKQELPL